MQLITFKIDDNRYGIDTDCIIEVLPMQSLTELPGDEAYVAGLLNYRGQAVPVIDMTQLLAQRDSHKKMSTRIIVIHYRMPNYERTLGLVVEKATEIISRDIEDLSDYGIQLEDAKHLGNVIYDDLGMIQVISTDQILSAPIQQKLFREAREAS